MTAALRHAADCRGADLQATAGRLGGLVIRCRTCARFVLLGATDATAEAVGASGPAPSTRPAPRPPRARPEPQEPQGSGLVLGLDPERLVYVVEVLIVWAARGRKAALRHWNKVGWRGVHGAPVPPPPPLAGQAAE